MMSNMDWKGKNKLRIEMRILEKYEKVKDEIMKVIDLVRDGGSKVGMCKILDNENDGLWDSVIKGWLEGERFGIRDVWFSWGFSLIGYGEYDMIRGNGWLKSGIDKIDRENGIFGYWFGGYKKYMGYRIRVLRLGLKDLERIKEEYGKD